MIFQMVKLMHGLRENMDKKSWLKYYTCPGATDSVNMSEVDSVVENFVRDALSQCDQSTVSETFKRVHCEGCFLGRKSYIHEKHSQGSIEFNFKILILGNA